MPDEAPKKGRRVDVVYFDSQSNDYTLGLLEAREWDSIPQHELFITTRINDYVSFALDGQLEMLHPNSKGKPVTINLLFAFPPNDKWLRHFERLRAETGKYGIRFETTQVPR